jgi:hypothetical protein
LYANPIACIGGIDGFGSDRVLRDLLEVMPLSRMQSVACDAIYQRAIGADALQVSKETASARIAGSLH